MSRPARGIVAAARDAWRRLRHRPDREDPPALLPARRAYELWAPTYDSPPTALQELEARARRRLSAKVEGARVLDLGCGTGRVARELLRHGASEVVGLDFVRPMLARARRESAASGGSAASWVAGEASRLPFRADVFGGAVCALVMGHLTDPAPALAEIARVIRPDGWLIVSDFHPGAAAHGWVRTFAEPASGRTYRVEQTPHAVEAYLTRLEELGFAPAAVSEEAYRGVPVVFALLARGNPARHGDGTARGDPAARGDATTRGAGGR